MNNVINNSYKKPNQYHLKRQMIKQYGQQKQDLNTWVAEHYHFKAHENILELGCGTGEFWQSTYKLLDKTNDLTLTDNSAEMLDQTKSNLSRLNLPCKVDYMSQSIDDLDLPNNYYDIILAHLMIYHAADLNKSLDDIVDTLKPSGWFGVTTQAKDSFKSHMEVANTIDSSMPDYCINTPAETEKLAVLLKERFNQVKQYDYINPIHWPSGKIATDFSRLLLSIAIHHPTEEFYKQYEQAIDQIIQTKGSFITSIKMSLFICHDKKV